MQNLPKEVTEVLTSGELSETLQALAKKYKIHYDKWDYLENSILEVLVNIKQPADLYNTLLNNTGIDKEDAKKLLADLIELVFKPMRKLLQKSIASNNVEMEQTDDPRAPVNIKKMGADLDKPFNIGDLPQITDPYREKIE